MDYLEIFSRKKRRIVLDSFNTAIFPYPGKGSSRSRWHETTCHVDAFSRDMDFVSRDLDQKVMVPI